MYSAGSSPTQINPYAIDVLKETGIDASGHWSKGMDDVPLAEADWVITLCAEEVCPVGITQGKKLHWPLPDPAGAPPDQIEDRFRETRNQIKERIDRFWDEITAT